MHRFQPTRASPPIRRHSPDVSMRTDVSRNTNDTVAPELQNLTSDDIEILDVMIKRAGPGATTFFPIFKAYTDVLNERGLDPDEVLYYEKLLKIGTLKGKDWDDKWKRVKGQAGQQLPLTVYSFPSESRKHPHVLSESPLSDDQYSSVSQMHIPDTHVKISKRNHPTVQRSRSKEASKAPRISKKLASQNQIALDPNEFPILASLGQRSKQAKQIPQVILSDDEGTSSSPVPPSYKSTALDSTLPSHPRQRIQTSEKPIIPTGVIGHARQMPSIPKEKPKAVDLDDAWKNIKMQQDEEFADKYRDDLVLARCWEMWRQGFEWITTTHQQIGEARDKLLLRLSIQRWQTQLNNQHVQEDGLVKQFDICRAKIFFRVWQAKLKHKRQIAWRNDMRQKLKSMKIKSEIRLINGAWKTWRQLYLEHRADILYQSNLVARHHIRWKERLARIDDKFNLADRFLESVQFAHMKGCFQKWSQSMAIRRNERVIISQVDRRIMTNSLDLWRKRMVVVKFADQFRDRMILEHAIQAWKNSRHKLTVLEKRATKHVTRQDDLLLRVIIRIWRARMRGKRLEEYTTSLAMKRAWQAWKDRIADRAADLVIADKFFERSNTRVTGSALVCWHKILVTHRNAHQYAVEYHAAHQREKYLLLWRLRLRDAHQCAKVARWANRFFDTRRAWNVWIVAMEARKVERRLKEWNTSRLRNFMQVWKDKKRERQDLSQWDSRIKSRAINQWMKRVIYVKSRELDVAQQEDTSLLRSAFDKWQRCIQQHTERVSLLENYLLLKQEDVLHRAFHRWRKSKQAAEERRMAQQQQEAQLRQLAITSAWEKWRERFVEAKLLPLEYEVILANQRNVMIHFFNTWRSKTKSLPALKFHSRHTKQNFFKKWRMAMPNAMRMKKAREADRYNTLVRAFEKWLQVYKTRTTLKAVARAKYLRLPAAPARSVVTKSRPLRAGSMFPRRPMESELDDESQAEEPPLPEPTKISSRLQLRCSVTRSERSAGGSEYGGEALRPVFNADNPRRFFIPRTELISSKPRTERSIPRSDYTRSAARQPSPVRSIASMPDRRSRSPYSSRVPESSYQPRGAAEGGKLWAAMKDLPQRRSRSRIL